MTQRVFVVLVARNGEAYLPQTIDGIQANADDISAIVTVDVSSDDRTSSLLAELNPRHSLRVAANATFAESVAVGLYALSSDGAQDDDVIWILHDDSAPLPGALRHLSTAFELGPSIAIAGPKIVQWDNHSRLSEFGLTTTTTGRRVAIGAGQLDQSQFDDTSDVLAVGTAGMLVRRSILTDLAGFDASLSFGDDGLDLCVRARLTGTRVVRVPEARVAHASSDSRAGSLVRRGYGAMRRDQWYRQIVYANAPVAFFRWITVVLVALGASIGHLISKHPGRVPGELWAAIGTLFSVGQLARGRRRFRRTKRLPLASLSSLLQKPAETRAARAADRERDVARRLQGIDLTGEDEFRYWESRAPWTVLFAAIFAVIVWFPLVSASALTGGGAAPLSSLGVLWGNAGQFVADIVSGAMAPPDAFATVLALIGSVTPWAPSLAVVWLFIAAFPLAAFAGGVVAGRVLRSGRAAVIGSVLWMFAPPFVAALAQGRIGAIIVHLSIPFVAYFMAVGFDRRRTTAQSVTAFSAAALVAALAVASAPSILLVLIPAWIVVLLARPRYALLTVWTVIPSLAVILPTAVAAFVAGTPLQALADPGLVVAFDTPSRLTVLAGLPTTDALGLRVLAQSIGLPGVYGLAAPVVVILLFAGFALFTKRWMVAICGVATYLLVALAAVALSTLTLSSVSGAAVAVWTGSLLSVGYLGLVLAAAGAASPEKWYSSVAGVVAAMVAVAVVIPWVATIASGGGEVTATTDSVFPAIVEASKAEDPDLRVLVLVRHADGTVSATLDVATAGRLDTTNTILNQRSQVSDGHIQLSSLSAALLTPGASATSATGLRTLGVRFVLYQGSEANDTDVRLLNTNPAIDKVATTDSGELWEVTGAKSLPAVVRQTDWVSVVIRGGILVLFLLLAIPTSRPARQISRADDDPLPAVGGDDDE